MQLFYFPTQRVNIPHSLYMFPTRHHLRFIGINPMGCLKLNDQTCRVHGHRPQTHTQTHTHPVEMFLHISPWRSAPARTAHDPPTSPGRPGAAHICRDRRHLGRPTVALTQLRHRRSVCGCRRKPHRSKAPPANEAP